MAKAKPKVPMSAAMRAKQFMPFKALMACMKPWQNGKSSLSQERNCQKI